MVTTPGGTMPEANPLFTCAYCDSPVRDTMIACPHCRLALDAGQVVLRRFAILLSECGSWHRSGDVPPAAADRLMMKYRREYDAVLGALGQRSEQFQPHVVPGAVAVASVTPSSAPVRRGAPARGAARAPAPPPAATPFPGLPAATPSGVPFPLHPAPGQPAVSPEERESAPVVRISGGDGGSAVESAPRALKAPLGRAAGDGGAGLTSEAGLAWLANAGIFAVFVAIVLLVRNHWSSFDAGARVGILGVGAAAAMGLGGLLRRTMLRTTGTSIMTLGALSVPVIFAAAAWFTPDANVSAIGLFGAMTSTALYYVFARIEGLSWFRWLGVSSAAAGSAFLLGTLRVPGPAFAHAMMIAASGFALAARILPKQAELRVAGILLQCGALLTVLPFGMEAPATIAIAGHAAAVASFSILALETRALWHLAWIALGAGALFVPHAFRASPTWFPVSLAIAAALPLAGWASGRERFRDLFAGAALLYAGASIGVLALYAVPGSTGRPDDACLWTALVALPAIAAAAWRRDSEGWAVVALLLPVAIAVPIRRIYALDAGFLPVSLGFYAAVLMALRTHAGPFSRVSGVVGVLAHAGAVLVAINPGPHLKISAGLALPFYWNDLAWRGALALALPGLAQLAFRVKSDPRWIYAAQPSLLGALLFALHALGLGGEWACACAAGASLGAIALARGAWAAPSRNVGTAAAMAAVVSGVLNWGTPAGVVSLLAAAAFAPVWLGTVRRGPTLVTALLAGLGGWSAAEWRLAGPMVEAAAALVFVPAVLAGFALRSREDRTESSLGAGIASLVPFALLLFPAVSGLAAPGLPAAVLGALAGAALLQSHRGTGEPAWAFVAGLLGVGAGYLSVAHLTPAAVWRGPLLLAIPLALAALGRVRITAPQSVPLLLASGLGSVLACALVFPAGGLGAGATFALASLPALVFASLGPGREGHGAASVLGLSVAGAFLAHEVAAGTAHFPALCALVPAGFCALGAWSHALPQGRAWSATGGVLLGVAVGAAVREQSALAFGLTALVASAGAASALRWAPAVLAGTAAFFFNVAVVAFFVHADVPPLVAGPCLMALAALESLAASMAGVRATAHAVFVAAGALVLGALGLALTGAWSATRPDLLPAIASVAVLSATAGILAVVRRQSYLVVVAIAAAAADYFLFLAHRGVTTVEIYTFPPAALILAWTHFAARREIRVVESPEGGPAIEATLSRWARSLPVAAREQASGVRAIALAVALGHAALASLPATGGAHVPWILIGGAIALAAGVLDRRKLDVLFGAGSIVGVAGWKGLQWMYERDVSGAWWMLIVGGVLLGMVAAFEIRRSWFLKGRGEGVRKLLEKYLGEWR